MELSWSDDEVPLSSFLERFTLPQIVQVGEGLYGETDETTLSRGQELNLHLLKDTQCYSGITETGEELHIPLNSPHKVHIFSEKRLEKYDSPRELSALFPQKYKHVRLQSSQENSSDNTETIKAGETLRALYFDKDRKNLVCVDKHGCEVTLEMHQLSAIKVIEKTKDAVFIAEVFHRFSLPLTVQFIPQANTSVQLARGLIHLKKVIVKQTVVATSRDVDCTSILTFPGALDVTVIAPQETTLAHPEYRKLCENLNMKVNLKKVEETIEKDEELYDDVKACIVKAIPYAEAFFGNRAALCTSAENNNNYVEPDEYLDEDNYVDIDRTLFTRPVEVTRQESRSTTLPATRSETSLVTLPGTNKQNSHTKRSISLPATRSETSLVTLPGTSKQNSHTKQSISLPATRSETSLVTSPGTSKQNSHTKRSISLPATRSETSFATLPGTNKQNSHTKQSITLPATRRETSLVTSPGTSKQKKSSFIKKLTRKLSKGSSSDMVSRGSTSSATSPTTTSPGTDVFHRPNEGKGNDDSDSDDDDVYEMPESRLNVYDKSSNQTRTKIIEDNKKIEDFTVQEIGMLLSDLNLSQYGGAFEREQVDGRILKDLEKEMLQSHFNMTPFHAHKLKKAAMENWRPTVTGRK